MPGFPRGALSRPTRGLACPGRGCHVQRSLRRCRQHGAAGACLRLGLHLVRQWLAGGALTQVGNLRTAAAGAARAGAGQARRWHRCRCMPHRHSTRTAGSWRGGPAPRPSLGSASRRNTPAPNPTPKAQPTVVSAMFPSASLVANAEWGVRMICGQLINRDSTIWEKGNREDATQQQREQQAGMRMGCRLRRTDSLLRAELRAGGRACYSQREAHLREALEVGPAAVPPGFVHSTGRAGQSAGWFHRRWGRICAPAPRCHSPSGFPVARSSCSHERRACCSARGRHRLSRCSRRSRRSALTCACGPASTPPPSSRQTAGSRPRSCSKRGSKR